MANFIKFTVTGKPDYIKVVRIGVGTMAGNEGFDIEAVEDIQLAVDEACKIITCHGFNAWTNVYEVKCEADDTKMTVSLVDTGEGRNLNKTCRICKNCPQDGEISLILIRTLMDEVEIKVLEDNKRSIVMVKNK